MRLMFIPLNRYLLPDRRFSNLLLDSQRGLFITTDPDDCLGGLSRFIFESDRNRGVINPPSYYPTIRE
ncbi:MAG: hypothetical protein JSW12_00520 [Deltaproteobacteria bacterium]|nr:MAG: hypothetical protein JSW12_00520 [Deltaproteobacteria bacterium]